MTIPKTQLKYIIDRMHVGDSDDKVRREIRMRVAHHPGWTQKLVAQAEVYALKVHRDNQKMYAYVMGGSVGRKSNPGTGAHQRMLELEYRARHGAPLSVREAAELKRIYDRLGVGFLHRVALRTTRNPARLFSSPLTKAQLRDLQALRSTSPGRRSRSRDTHQDWYKYWDQLVREGRAPASGYVKPRWR